MVPRLFVSVGLVVILGLGYVQFTGPTFAQTPPATAKRHVQLNLILRRAHRTASPTCRGIGPIPRTHRCSGRTTLPKSSIQEQKWKRW
jgi:hypothetical protein